MSRRSTPATSAPPQRRRRVEREALPLGSLTQRGDRPHGSCAACGSPRVTELAMQLTDGTPVRFVSCRACEHRSWQHEGGDLTVGSVLDRTRKTA